MSSRLTRILAAGIIAAATVIGTSQTALADPGGSGGSGDGSDPIIVVGGASDTGTGGGEVDTGIGITTNQNGQPPAGADGSDGDGSTHQSSSGHQSDGNQSGDTQDGWSLTQQTCVDLQLVTPTPPAGDARWKGADPATHDLYTAFCADAIFISSGAFARVWVYLVADKGKAPVLPQPPPDPADLASTLWVHMRTLIPAPGATTSPDLPHNTDATTGQSVTYVNLWMWYWTPAKFWTPISQTLSQRGVTVTVTAAPDTLTYDPGNGAGPVVCATPPGRPWTAADGNSDPHGLHGCGYQYIALSPSGRTITATLSISWNVTWTSNVGVAGALPAITTSTRTVPFVVEEIPVEVK